MALVVYTYQKCSTCRAATAWLRDRNVAFEERPIRETPPTMAELSRALKLLGGRVRALCNTSGESYRALGLKDRLDAMPLDEVLTLLAGDGMLVKRPLVLGKGFALAGFNEEKWAAALGV